MSARPPISPESVIYVALRHPGPYYSAYMTEEHWRAWRASEKYAEICASVREALDEMGVKYWGPSE